jgi:two-component system, NarL family, sensor histidine kinase UhpB
MDDHTKILLVEDNPEDARLVMEMLGDAVGQTYALEWVTNLAEALQRLSRGDIDLVMLDLALPDSRGLNTLVKAYEQAPQIPFIVLTGLADETMALAAVRQGAQDYLFKDELNPNLLGRAIRYATERKRAERTIEAERRKLYSVLNGLPAFVYLRGADFKIRFANLLFREIFGDPEDKPCYQVLWAQSGPCELCRPLNVLQTMVPNQYEVTFSSSARTCKIQNYPFRTEDGLLVLTLGTDITEHKRAEAVLRGQQEQLEIQVRERTKELTQTNEILKMEIAVRQKTEKALQDSRQNLQLLASQLLTVQEEERRLVFREVYEGIGQNIVGIKMHLKTIGSQLGKDQQNLKVSYEQVLAYIDKVMENVRHISWDQTASILEELGFSSSLANLIAEICRNNQIESSVAMAEIDRLFPLEDEINIYRIFQELLTNIVRHAQATKVSVSIERQADHVAFLIEDNGTGFDRKKVLSGNDPERGLGLTTLNERARLMGGSLAIRTRQGQGTKIRLTIPIKT